MQRNKVGYLGLLGFFGPLGLLTGYFGFYGFFGFFGLLSALWGRRSDERVNAIIDRVCRDAFIFSVVASTFYLACIAVLGAQGLIMAAFSVVFAGNLMVFVASFILRDRWGE